MSDEADRAEIAEQRDRKEALERFRDSIDWCEPQLIEDGIVICRECLDPIQPERLRANPRACHCLDCQIDIDRREKLETINGL